MKRHPYILVVVTAVATLGVVQTLGCGATLTHAKRMAAVAATRRPPNRMPAA